MAARFWVGGNANWDATAGTKWSTTSGGAGGAAVPTSADDVHLDNGAGTGNVTITVGANCLSIDCTGYVHTLTLNSTLTSAGNVTVVAGMTIAGTSDLIFSANGTLTSNGKAFTGGFRMSGTTTVTLADDATFNGNFTGNVTNASTNINGAHNINIAGNVTWGNTNVSCTGTATIIMNGTGQLSATGSNSQPLKVNLTFNTAGTITVVGGITYGHNSTTTTLKYVAGTMITTGSTLSVPFNFTFTVIDTNTMHWNNFAVELNGSMSILSDLNLDGNFTGPTTVDNTSINGLFNINVAKNFTCTGVGFGGTCTVVLNGSGTQTISIGATTKIQCNFTINSSGTVNFPSVFLFEPLNSSKTFTYTAGTLGVASTSFTFGAITSGTVTVLLNASGFNPLAITIIGFTTTFGASTFGWTTPTFTCTTAGVTIQLTSTVTYEITTNMTVTGTLASPVLIRSTIGGSRAILTLDNTATASHDVFCNATDIDSSLGQTIISFGATLTNTINWNVLAPPKTISYGQVA